MAGTDHGTIKVVTFDKIIIESPTNCLHIEVDRKGNFLIRTEGFR